MSTSTMEQWRADRLMKRAKKKARKSLEKEGYHRKTAAKLVNQALKRINNDREQEIDNSAPNYQ